MFLAVIPYIQRPNNIYKPMIARSGIFPVGCLFREKIGHDTVGAVALDTMGNVAFGTSTGGITAKKPGRVGRTEE
jgi:isoaspartyl peptidase/L-asparaginase-like protein (Ntn-hydrolase superfamily)